MPELPEVETTIRGLKKYILGQKIKNVFSDAPKLVKKPVNFKIFANKITGRKIKSI